MKKFLPVTFLTACVLFALSFLRTEENLFLIPGSKRIALPQFELMAVEENLSEAEKISSKDFKGRRLVMFFIYPDCPISIKNNEFVKTLAFKNIEVYGMFAEEAFDARVKSFTETHGNHYVKIIKADNDFVLKMAMDKKSKVLVIDEEMKIAMKFKQILNEKHVDLITKFVQN